MRPRLPPLQLTNPTSTRPTCPACGKQVKDMSRHAGTGACANEARRAMIGRLGLVEVWFREKMILTAAHVPVTVIRDQRGKRSTMGSKPDKRRWYAPPEPVASLRALFEGKLSDKRIAQLLRGPKEELEREVAMVALAGRREEQQPSARAVMNAQSLLETGTWHRVGR